MTITAELNEAKATIKTMTAELEALKGAGEKCKTELLANQAKVEIMVKTIEGHIQAAAEIEKTHAESLAKKDAEIGVLTASLAEANKKLSLDAYTAVTPGQQPVAVGGAASDVKRDWYKEWRAMSGSEKVAFYRAHEKEINASFASK